MKSLIFVCAMLFVIPTFAQTNKSKNASIAVWDTYVTKDGTIMHFDIIASSEIKDTTVIYSYGKEYLKAKISKDNPNIKGM
ncbi:MAG: DUF2024 family protein [Flavobacteriaceae bacterium]